jgi:hypothetical protein
MKYDLFLHYGWFLKNLGKDFIRTNIHTSVCSKMTFKIYAKFFEPSTKVKAKNLAKNFQNSNFLIRIRKIIME